MAHQVLSVGDAIRSQRAQARHDALCLQSRCLSGRGEGITVSMRPSWKTQCIYGQPGLQNETLSQKTSKQASKQAKSHGPWDSQYESPFLWRRRVSKPEGESWPDSNIQRGEMRSGDSLKAIVPGPLSYGICVELSAHVSWVSMRQ